MKYEESEENFLLIDLGDNFLFESCLKKLLVCLGSITTSLKLILFFFKKTLKDFKSERYALTVLSE
jgi:hypothetical protein